MTPREERLVNELERQRALVQKLLGQIDDLTETVAIRDATIAVLSDENDNLADRVNVLQEECQDYVEEIRDLNSELSDAQWEATNARAEAASWDPGRYR